MNFSDRLKEELDFTTTQHIDDETPSEAKFDMSAIEALKATNRKILQEEADFLADVNANLALKFYEKLSGKFTRRQIVKLIIAMYNIGGTDK